MLYAEILRQRLKLVNAHIVADTIDYLEAKFEFRTDDWDGLDKWAHFAKDSAVYDIRLTDNCIRKEDHLNLSAGMWKVYLHGNEFRDGEVVQRITTDEVVLYVIPTGILDGEPFPTVPPSAGEQIIASAAASEAGAKSAADAAGRAAESAKASADLAAKSAEITGNAEQIVQDALRDAKESGEFDGEDGITPHIGANGNWFVGETDTGIRAQGKDGKKGDPGDDYILTAEDKQEIAGLIPSGGNVGNVLILVGGASLDSLRIEFVAPPAGVSVDAAYELIGRGLFDVAVQTYSDDGNDLIGVGILRGMPVSDAVGAIGEFWAHGNVSLVNVVLDFAAMTAYAETMYTSSGGGGVVTIMQDADGSYTCSHTPAEIAAMAQTGAVVAAVSFADNDSLIFLSMIGVSYDIAMFSTTVFEDGDISMVTVFVSDDAVVVQEEENRVAPMTGASAADGGKPGTVPAPAAGQQDAVLHGDGTWRQVAGGTSVEIDSTLTQAGKAADAKVTGEKIDSLSKAIANKAESSAVPASAEIDANNLISFKSTNGTVLFTLQLYCGGSGGDTGEDDVIIPVEPTDIMSQFKYLGATTYSPGTYTAWCPTGLIYDETRDTYAHFMTVRGSHYNTPDQIELWFNTINPETLEHSFPVFVGKGASNVTSGGGFTANCIKDGVYYAFSQSFGYYTSSDGGNTWEHHDYTTAPSGVWGCYVLSNGRMIMGADTGATATYCSYSDDNGATWIKNETGECFNEPTIIEFDNGTLMAIIRKQIASTDPLAKPYFRVSTDYGETWTDPVEMQTVGEMNATNCNAYCHDGYVELFVGCRIPSTNSDYTGTIFRVNQYIMDKSKGAVDEFEFVSTVYDYQPENNEWGLTTTTQTDFSTPCIAIKDKSHALMMFYAPCIQGVTHHLIAVGNIPVDNFEIPSIIPSEYAASQSFSGSADDVTVTITEYVGGNAQGNNLYPYTYGTGYLRFDDIKDGGFVHIKYTHILDSTSGYPAFINVEGGKVKSGVGDILCRSPLPEGVSDLRLFAHQGFGTKVTTTETDGDIYAFIKDGIWWCYLDGTWWRNYQGDNDITNSVEKSMKYNTDYGYTFPYRVEGLTNYKVLTNMLKYRQVKMIEYDKDASLLVEVPCAGITLSADTLSFTSTTKQTIKPTLTPISTTDGITWECDNTSVATVVAGVVTPVASGTATITAKCGEYTAMCEVIVSIA